MTEEQRKQTKERAEKIILDAEKFRADIAAPKGKLIMDEITEDIRIKRLLDNDDDFFHVTCHVDNSLKSKIRNGEFVELEKLLPKERGLVTLGGSGEELDFRSFIEAIARGGNTYLGPGLDHRDKKINSIHRWEQAFRVYAAIYTEAHPARAAEIWQYVYTINTTAQTFTCDNVYYYDQTFRRLMEEKPWRSWSKTCTRGWNIAMRDINNGQGHRLGNNHNQSALPQRKKDLKDDCCWKFNKNRCNRNDCNYDHRCTFCGGWKHGYLNCRKRSKQGSGGTSTSNSGGGSQKKKDNSPSKSN